MKQTALTDELGVRFHKAQWRESGICDVSADERSGGADAVNVDVGDFTGRDDAAAGTGAARSIAPLTVRAAVELLECFHGMAEPRRIALLEIAKALSQPIPDA